MAKQRARRPAATRRVARPGGRKKAAASTRARASRPLKEATLEERADRSIERNWEALKELADY